jgi:hypothetical protein
MEDEKNALLDYIEENIEKQNQSARGQERNQSFLNVSVDDKIKQLEYEKSKLY